MKITISVNGRFHGFDLAAQMERLGHLHCLLTSYPYSKVAEWGIPKSKVKTCVSLELTNRAVHKMKGDFKEWAYGRQHKAFDNWASRNVPLDSDIVIGWSSSFIKTLRAAKKNNIKTVVERGSSHILFQRKILEEQFEQFGKKFIPMSELIVERELQEYEESDFISVPSEFVKNSFVANGVPETKLVKNPYGVNLESFKKSENSKKSDKLIIVCCGSLSIRKGTLELIEIFKELKLFNSELWLVGGISDELKRTFSKFKDENIKILGTFPQNKLAEVYSKADVFCLNSYEEGLAMVIPQAMACGLPVICSYNSGGSEVIDDKKEGFIYESGDRKKLKELVKTIFDSKVLRAEMGKAARQKVESGFSWDDYGERMVEIYSRILSESQ